MLEVAILVKLMLKEAALEVAILVVTMLVMLFQMLYQTLRGEILVMETGMRKEATLEVAMDWWVVGRACAVENITVGQPNIQCNGRLSSFSLIELVGRLVQLYMKGHM